MQRRDFVKAMCAAPVADGFGFVSGGWQNPTTTLTALAMRASEHSAEEMRQGNV